jgi:methylaspartate ammonia-lyase|tara:strand:- start:57 stop:335 length:279 start_codon:yes stop_codon:yes gene_type:complete
MNHKIARRLYQALESKYTAQIMDARATLSIYFESPVAIGEHPQHTEEIDKLLGQLESATGKLDTLSKNFGSEYGANIPTTHVDEKGKEILKG